MDLSEKKKFLKQTQYVESSFVNPIEFSAIRLTINLDLSGFIEMYCFS